VWVGWGGVWVLSRVRNFLSGLRRFTHQKLPALLTIGGGMLADRITNDKIMRFSFSVIGGLYSGD